MSQNGWSLYADGEMGLSQVIKPCRNVIISPLTLDRKLLDQALRVYSGREQLRPEQARTSFRMGKLLKVLQDEKSAEYFTKAFSIYRDLKGADRAASSLVEADFDDLVAFWTR
jgi:hypothetical protein